MVSKKCLAWVFSRIILLKCKHMKINEFQRDKQFNQRSASIFSKTNFSKTFFWNGNFSEINFIEYNYFENKFFELQNNLLGKLGENYDNLLHPPPIFSKPIFSKTNFFENFNCFEQFKKNVFEKLLQFCFILTKEELFFRIILLKC